MNDDKDKKKRQRLTYMKIFTDLQRRVNEDDDGGVRERRLAREERRAALAQDYREGMSLAELGAKYDVSRQTIYNDLKKMKVSLRRGSS